jgi:H+/Cl- antiporter ClcA
MRDREPDFWRNLRKELAPGGHWLDRMVVLAYAAATGLVVVGFTLLTEAASEGFDRLRHASAIGPWLPLLWTPLLSVGLLWWTRRFAPATAGSGSPQVVLALEEATAPSQQARLVSLPLSLHKVALVAGGLLAGLSIGREGPTVHVGAGVMQHARRWLSPDARSTPTT